MAALREWVGTLVTLVLLAGALELLVPKGNFKGYVRLTMGLVLVLGMIQPALKLLRQPVELPALEERYLSEAGVASSKAMQERITAYQQTQTEQIRQAFAQRLTAAMVTTVRQVPGVHDARVAVQLGTPPGRNQPPPIIGVTVWVRDGLLAAIAPVRVDAVQAGPPKAPAAQGPTDLTAHPLGQSVAAALAREYGVAQRLVRVVAETGSPTTGAKGGDGHAR